MKRYLAAAAIVLALIQGTSLAQDDAQLADRAKGISQQLLQQLAAELRKEMSAGGPVQAIAVCKVAAPEIAGRLSRTHGVKVSRVSLKVRNPLLGQPDAWEQEVLLRFEKQLAAGEKVESLEHAEVVNEPQGRYFRYMRAIGVQPLCLACHGDSQSFSPALSEVLTQDYPHDKARGYRAGQVRGAVSIKQALESP